MKMTKFAGICVALIAILSLAMFVSCGGGSGGGTKSPEKDLTDLKIAGVGVDGGTLPAPISDAVWKDIDANPYLTGGVFTLPAAAFGATNVTITPTVTGGKVEFGKGLDDQRNKIKFGNVASVLPFASGDTLFVKITASNGSVQYYKFMIMNESSSASLTGLTIAGVTATVGSSGIAWNTIPGDGGLAELTNAQKTNAAITVTVPTNAKVRFATVAASGPATPDFTTEPNFTAIPVTNNTATITFADADVLYIEVTSADETTVWFYKVVLEVGRNAKLASIAIEKTARSEALYLGLPQTAWNAAGWSEDLAVGNFQTERQPAAGLGMSIVPQDDEATIKYAVVEEAAPGSEPSWTAYTGPVARRVFDIESTYYLYVEVTAAAGNKLYYKMKLIFPAKGKLVYANPEITDAQGNFFYDATIWDDPSIQTYYINRVNEAETIEPYMRQPWGLHTSATAKAVWNDEGIFVYANITTTQYRKTAGGPLLDRPLASSADDGHQGDSFEVFVNERYQKLEDVADGSGQADIGNQFRVGVRGTRSGRPAGSASWPQTANGPAVYDDFVANGISAVRIKGTDGTATSAGPGGYEVLVFVPFSEQENVDANAVFENGTYGKQVTELSEIGFELQMNTGVVNGDRDGILTWNGVTTASYAHAENYGLVTMDLAGKTRVTNAQKPRITTQPVGDIYDAGDSATPLTVVASVTQTGGSLSYQWYKATTFTGDGVSLGSANGAQTASYTPQTGSNADSGYYYVVVTHTNNPLNGKKTNTATSNRALVNVDYQPPANWAERITTRSTNAPAYVFDIGSRTLSEYSSVTFKVKVEPNSLAKSGRMRAWAPFTVGDFSFGTTVNRPDMGNTVGAKLLHQDGGTSFDYADWTALTIPFSDITNGTITGTSLTTFNAATGQVVLAFGFIGGGSASNDAKTYYVSEIRLVGTTAPAVPAMYPAHPRLWAGQGAGAYVTQNGNDVVTRVLWDDVSQVTLEPPPPVKPPNAPTPFVVDLSDSDYPKKNATAWTTNYNSGLIFPLKDASAEYINALALTYNKIKVVAKFYDASEEELTTIPNGDLQVKFFPAPVSSANGSNPVTTLYNFGVGATANPDTAVGGLVWTGTVPAGLYISGTNLRTVGIQTSGGASWTNVVKFVEVLSITVVYEE